MSVVVNLEGKVAIITGASRGIGEAIARCFAANGARVVLAARKIEGLAPIADSLNQASTRGDVALAVATHTGHEAQCAELVRRAIEVFGKVDVLVNNAATNPHFGPMLDADEGAWNKTFEVNAKGYFWMTREVARHLQGRDAPGSIINMASVAGLLGSPGQGIYSMTKAAVIAMTRTLAIELAGSKIRVNAIAPGFVDTKFASAVLKNEVLLDEVLKMTPMRRYGQPDEIAGGALFLASDSASYLTGHTLVIDGGMTIA
ncbi:MAG: Oxidoreductase, short-chain dehydrogenase/reductase family [Labilithrix sp.]|nr:Oxidoreductase, short-chain dehydrogenase/reductase family [Labilithrix sp.]